MTTHAADLGLGLEQAPRTVLPSSAPPALVTRGIAVSGAQQQLWCDPLTGLIAYPSFAEGLTAALPAVAPGGVHLAIGDVDDLREYVSQRRREDPTMFGHLAGNQCMQTIGTVTRQWSHRALGSASFALCGTFGGDEVIVAAAGPRYDTFASRIGDLIAAIGVAGPWTCSFAVGTLAPQRVGADADDGRLYREFVAAVDAALFERKAELRASSGPPRGELVCLGVLGAAQGAR